MEGTINRVVGDQERHASAWSRGSVVAAPSWPFEAITEAHPRALDGELTKATAPALPERSAPSWSLSSPSSAKTSPQGVGICEQRARTRLWPDRPGTCARLFQPIKRASQRLSRASTGFAAQHVGE